MLPLILISGLFLAFSYLMLPFAGFIAPYTANERQASHLYAPPQGISFFHDGKFIGPHVYKTTASRCFLTYPLRCSIIVNRWFDRYCRIIYLGYLVREHRRLFRRQDGLDHTARHREQFVQAAEMMGAKPSRVIRKHLLPNFASHLIASAMLSIPGMILGETALSFLGLGLRAPAVSWGVMLNDAQNLAAIEIYPWTAIPMLPIILVVLAFNFLGDGLRDSLDPYSH